MKTLSTIQKELDRKLPEAETYISPSDYNELLLIIKSFLTISLKQLLEQVVPEVKEVCKCEEEDGLGYHTKECDMAAYGFNACRQEVEDRIKNLLNN